MSDEPVKDFYTRMESKDYLIHSNKTPQRIILTARGQMTFSHEDHTISLNIGETVQEVVWLYLPSDSILLEKGCNLKGLLIKLVHLYKSL
jgi:hypothetical protein